MSRSTLLPTYLQTVHNLGSALSPQRPSRRSTSPCARVYAKGVIRRMRQHRLLPEGAGDG